MGTVRFVLRTDKPNKDGSCPIRLIYQIHGERKYYSPNIKLFPPNWDEVKRKAIYQDKRSVKKMHPSFDYDLLATSNEVDEINQKLSSIKEDIRNIEKRFEFDHIQYSTEMIVDQLKERNINPTKTQGPSNQIFDFIDQYIEENRLSREAGSLSVYKSLKNHLYNFQIEKKQKVCFHDIDHSFFTDFQNFLIKTKTKRAPNGLGNVTIAKQLSTLKTFLNYARMRGVKVSDRYKDFKIKKESLEVIALTNEEFETLYNLDLSKNKKLDQVRDVFCFSCATGLRYSDLSQLKREHIKGEEIRLTVTKTKQKLTVHLNPYSHSVLDKYSSMHKPLPVISNQKMNDYLKELCKEAEINEQVQIVRFHGAKRVEKTYPKYDLISVHTGRKTFATLSLEKGISAEEVMKMGGWKSYPSFARYVNITEKRTKIVMSKAWGEVPSKLKAV